MLRRCFSIGALTASFMLLGVGTVRVGFDLYTVNFTQEEVLLLVGIFIAALMALLVGKVAEPADAGGRERATGKPRVPGRFSKPIKEPSCMTCEYWYGKRVPDPNTRNVVTKAPGTKGTCIHRGGTYNDSRQAAAPPCESYEIWHLLA